MTLVDAPGRALPRTYLAWLAGFAVGRLGDATLAFALGWAATGRGATTAALVLVLAGLPRLVLLVVGGALADRVGSRRLLITGEAVLVVLTGALALSLARYGTATWLLVGASLALGTVTATCLPAAGSMPRRLVADEQLSRALALRQGVGQVLLLAAPPLGGLLVGTAGLPLVAVGAAVASAVSLCVLVAVREPGGPASAPGVGNRRLDLLGGVRVAARTPGLRAALLLAGAGAGLLLPVVSLLVPLLGRDAGWGPGTTGTVAGAAGVGAVAAALLAARPRRAGSGPGTLPAAVGLAVSASGVLALAVVPPLGGPVLAVVGALALGVGNGAFAARLAPAVLGSAPRTHLARVQALAGLAQLLPVLLTTATLGALAEHTSPRWVLAVTASGVAACALWARRRVPA